MSVPKSQPPDWPGREKGGQRPGRERRPCPSQGGLLRLTLLQPDVILLTLPTTQEVSFLTGSILKMRKQMQSGEVPCPRSWLKNLPESGQVEDLHLTFQEDSLGYPSLPTNTP